MTKVKIFNRAYSNDPSTKGILSYITAQKCIHCGGKYQARVPLVYTQLSKGNIIWWHYLEADEETCKTTVLNPFENRDLGKQLLFPTISWSSMNAFLEYDKNTWYQSYVLGNRTQPNSAMLGGIYVGEKIVSDPTFLPEIDRPEIFEHNLSGRIGNIKITGHLDGWTRNPPEIKEFKTSTNKNRWNQKLVDTWGQLDFYCLLVYMNYKIKPEDIKLSLTSIPMVETGHFELVQKGSPTIFYTKRTLVDIANFGVLIKQTHAQMLLFIKDKEL